MIHLNWSSSYKRAFSKAIKNDPALKQKILNTMNLIQQDPFSPHLKTHKLKGILEGAWACSIDYNLRIIFDFVKDPVNHETQILLISIGTHEEVY